MQRWQSWKKRKQSQDCLLQVRETQVKLVKLRNKKDRYLLVFISEKFRNAASGGLNNAVKPPYGFLSSLPSISLCFPSCVGFTQSAGGRPSLPGRKIFSGIPRAVFFRLGSYRSWLAPLKSHDLLWPHHCTPRNVVLWLTLTESWALMLTGQGITDIPNRVSWNEGWVPLRNLKKAIGNICWGEKKYWPLKSPVCAVLGSVAQACPAGSLKPFGL